MTDDDPTESEADAASEAAGPLGRIWNVLAGAVGWVADTFRGHSGARDLQNREK